jgi:cell division protein FtsL
LISNKQIYQITSGKNLMSYPNPDRQSPSLAGKKPMALPLSKNDDLKHPQFLAEEDSHTPRQQRVHKLPKNLPTPAWLKSLLSLQKGSKLIFLSIFSLTLIAYGYTAYIQDQWKEQHGKLKRLREQERQQVVINESLKYQLAEAAEKPTSGLVNPEPSRLVFLPAAPPRPFKSPTAPSGAWNIPHPSQTSVGY